VRGEQSAHTTAAATATAAAIGIDAGPAGGIQSANNVMNVTGSSKLTQPSTQKAKSSSTAEVTSELSKASFAGPQ
jgi:hypothetical protein